MFYFRPWLRATPTRSFLSILSFRSTAGLYSIQFTCLPWLTSFASPACHFRLLSFYFLLLSVSLLTPCSPEHIVFTSRFQYRLIYHFCSITQYLPNTNPHSLLPWRCNTFFSLAISLKDSTSCSVVRSPKATSICCKLLHDTGDNISATCVSSIITSFHLIPFLAAAPTSLIFFDFNAASWSRCFTA